MTIDALAIDIFRHQEGIARRGDSSIEQPGDVVVIQHGQKLALGFEAAEKFAVRQIAGHHFQCHRLLELTVGALGQIDRAHSSTAQQMERAVRAKLSLGRPDLR